MKKPVVIIALLVAALALGFILGQNVAPIERLKIIKEQVIDTVYRAKLVEVPVEKKVTTVDTVYVNVQDTVAVIEEDSDSIFVIEELVDEDSLQIKKDEKLKTETIQIVVLKDEAYDTLLNKLLEIEQVKQKQLIVEYWESPVNYKGYKLSKSKLIVYGIKPLAASELFKSENIYYFKANSIFYELRETSDFKSLTIVPKPDLNED